MYIFQYLSLLLLVGWTGANAASYQPRFTTPNYKNLLTGELCSDVRPARSLSCPVYGLRVVSVENDVQRWMDQSEIESRCEALTLIRCPEGLHLFPDGHCGDCPTDYPLLKSIEGNLWCEDAAGKTMEFENPFNCLGEESYPRSILNAYRPCYSSATAKQVSVPGYYKAYDLDGQLTMKECQSLIITEDEAPPSTVVTQNGITTHYDMHVIITTGIEKEHGFVQCPQRSKAVTYKGAGWWTVYIGYSVGLLTLLIYYLYKKGMEKKFQNVKTVLLSSPETREGTNINEDPFDIIEEKTVQTGYSFTFLGNVAWLSFWLMSWGMHVFLLMIALDMYGMHMATFCPQSFIDENCADPVFTWREGFACAATCLFSRGWTAGVYATWPYIQKTGGVEQHVAVTVAVFLILCGWWIAAVVFYNRLSIFFSLRCQLEEANIVVCSRFKEKDIRIESDKNEFFIRWLTAFEKLGSKWFGTIYDTQTCRVKRDKLGSKYFVFRCLKYTYTKEDGFFSLRSIKLGTSKADYVVLGLRGLTTEAALSRIVMLGENKINYDVPSLYESIWDEFFSLFYLYQIAFCWLWYIAFYWTVAIVISAVIAISGTISIMVKRASQRNMKRMSERITRVTAYRDGQWQAISSDNLVPGDVIRLHQGQYMAADAVLTSGRCVVNESSLTGEPTPVPKLSVSVSDEPYGKNIEDHKYTLLCGTVVEAVTMGETGDTRCVVLSTGPHTKQGHLVRTMIFPPRLRFKFVDHFSAVFFIMISLGFLLLLIVYWLMGFLTIGIYYGFFTLSTAFSPLIPAVFNAGQAKCSNILKKRNIYCVELNRTFVAGKLKVFCFDKTGTLTKQGMEYYGYYSQSNDGQGDARVIQETGQLKANARALLGSCHEVEIERIEGASRMLGNEVDIAMFAASSFEYYGSSKHLLIETATERKLRVVKRHEFSRDTMMMTAVVEDVESGQYFAFTKGSFEMVARCSIDESVAAYEKAAMKFSRGGFYILGVGWKTLSFEEATQHTIREDVEKELVFDGLLLFKNEIKPDTPDALKHLREGSITPLMITGDNVLTACAVARDCVMAPYHMVYSEKKKNSNGIVWRDFDTEEEVSILATIDAIKMGAKTHIAVTGDTFEYLSHISYSELAQDGERLAAPLKDMDAMRFLLPHVSVFARMKPEQKVDAVKLQMEFNITGMCGDGANDAAAMRVAHCGIALATRSGHATIVAPFSTEEDSLNVVVEVVRQSRAALASAFAGYKRLILFGLMSITMKLCTYHFAGQLSEVAWIFADGIVNICFSYAVMQSEAATRLTPTRPTSALLGVSVVLSVLFQLAAGAVALLGSLFWLYYQPWFQCKNYDAGLGDLGKWWTMGDNYESSIVAVVGMAVLVNLGFIFNLGFEYRKLWVKNYILLITWAIFISIVLTIVLSPPNFLTCLFRINCGDHSLMAHWNTIGAISYNGDVPLNLVPPGCPCSEQIVADYNATKCEAEYIDCPAEQYNQVFHHTIFPDDARIAITGFIALHFAVSLFLEWFVIFGPVRTYFRRLKFERDLINTNVEKVLMT